MYVVSPVQLFDTRQGLKLMKRWWRRQSPFERGRTGPPRIVGSLLLAKEGIGHAHEEYDQAHGRNIGPHRRNPVQAHKGVRIIGNASGHSRQSEEMHREER